MNSQFSSSKKSIRSRITITAGVVCDLSRIAEKLVCIVFFNIRSYQTSWLFKFLSNMMQFCTKRRENNLRVNMCYVPAAPSVALLLDVGLPFDWHRSSCECCGRLLRHSYLSLPRMSRSESEDRRSASERRRKNSSSNKHIKQEDTDVSKGTSGKSNVRPNRVTPASQAEDRDKVVSISYLCLHC